MNVEQIARLAAYQAQEVKQSGTLGPALTAAVVRSFVNDANVEAEKLIRRTRADFFTRVLNSATDTTAEKICGINYTPSTSLALAASTARYTLPPDFLSLKSLRCVTAGYEAVPFVHKDVASDDFQEQLKRSATDLGSLESGLYYDLIGERTLMIAPLLSRAADVELIYVAKPKRLHYYSTSTVTIADTTTLVTGAASVWLTGSPFDSAYLDLMVGTSGSATVPVADPTWVYDGVSLCRVAAIPTDLTLTLAAPKVGAAAAGTGYALASVPTIPEDAHYALADYATASVLAAVGTPGKAAFFLNRFQSRIAGITQTADLRQQSAVTTVEDYLPEGA